MRLLLVNISNLSVRDPNFGSKVDNLKTVYDEFRQTRDTQIIPLILSGKIEEAHKISTDLQYESYEKIMSLTNTLIEEAENRADASIVRSINEVNTTTKILGAIGVIAVLIACILSSVFQKMAANLLQLTKKISETVNVLSTSATEISSTTAELSSSAAETAVSVNETTSTIEEVRQTSQIASQKAKSVSDIAQKTTDVSNSGKKAASEMNTTISQIQSQMDLIADSMLRLSEQSQAIGEIITTVDDLAQQSNLLSVNASIEASKAGEHGKGFTIVAQEVKSLANQSKQATNQIRAILNDTQKATSAAVMATERGSKAVSEGVLKATETGTSILTLINSVTEASNAATQIAATSHQQFIGMEQAAVAMENIKQASAQNVEGTKQLAIAANNLKTLGEKLKKLVEQYRKKKDKDDIDHTLSAEEDN